MDAPVAGERVTLSSRLGFLLLSAGCAVGLGNVWRFPYIVGKYGGTLFVLFYILFLIILGLPCMVAELGIGRGGRATHVYCFRNLCHENKGFWTTCASVIFSGNLILMMFYSVVTGWLLLYVTRFATGSILTAAAAGTGFAAQFGQMLASPRTMFVGCLVGVVLTSLVCAFNIQKGLERVTKFLMMGLFLLMIGMVIFALTLPGSWQGVCFFLKPHAESFQKYSFMEIVFAAMGQAFFTLSLGIGSMSIFGSYMSKQKTLVQESVWIIILDTLVAICAGLIIFPCCFTFGIQPDAGPSLLFITLPAVFNRLPNGQFWGFLFFLFMAIAALTTLIAVSENLIAFVIERLGRRRPVASFVTGCILLVTSLPCIFGFNLWCDFHPFGGSSNVLDLEDFIVSNNLLPLGALLNIIFVTCKSGWGMKNFQEEANTGTGLPLAKVLLLYSKWILPVLILFLWITGIIMT